MSLPPPPPHAWLPLLRRCRCSWRFTGVEAVQAHLDKQQPEQVQYLPRLHS